MICVVQRVDWARVTVDGSVVGAIGPGLLILAGIAADDAPEDLKTMAAKIARLRIFSDADGLMNQDVHEAGGAVLAVSQFTLLADTRRGRRPSFHGAAPAAVAAQFMGLFVDMLRANGLNVQTGRFQAHMIVESANNGPVTIILDSRDRRAVAKS